MKKIKTELGKTMKRRFIDATTDQRCVWTIRLPDGSEAQCGRLRKQGELCTQHHNMREKMKFPCCGGSDENPPEHTMDCETRTPDNTGNG